MSIHHDDTSPQQGEKAQQGDKAPQRPAPKKNLRNAAQREALEGALKSKEHQHLLRTSGPDILDPLAEARIDSSKMLPTGQTYQQRATDIFKSHSLGPIYEKLLEGYGLTNPVLSLALLAPPDKTGDISHFKAVLCNIRQDMSTRYPHPVDLEARVWGVGIPNVWCEEGYHQELERRGITIGPPERQKVRLAIVKNAGVRNLHAFLHNVEHKMYAWNPLPVWQTAKVVSVPCFQAADLYVATIARELPVEKHDVARNLSAIMWNRRKLVDDTSMLRGNGIQGLQLAEIAINAAVTNYTVAGSSAKPSSQDVLRVINPGNKHFTEDLDKIFEKLKLGAEHPHRLFITELVNSARRQPDPDVAMRAAMSTIGERFSKDDLEKLLNLEYSLLPPKEPRLCPVPPNLEHQLESFLSSVMKSFLEAFQRDFLVRLSSLQYNVKDKTLVDARTSRNHEEIARLAELSVILAGIPRDRLEKPFSTSSTERFS